MKNAKLEERCLFLKNAKMKDSYIYLPISEEGVSVTSSFLLCFGCVSDFPDSRVEGPGSRVQVPSSGFQVPGSRCRAKRGALAPR